VEGTTFDLDYTKVDQILCKRVVDGDVQYLVKWTDEVKGYTWARHHPGYIAKILGFEMAYFYITNDISLTEANFPAAFANINPNRMEIGYEYLLPGETFGPEDDSDSDSVLSSSDSEFSTNNDSTDSADESYVEAQIENHIRYYNRRSRYNRTFEMDRIIGVSVNEDDLSFLVKWKNIEKFDIVPFLIVHRKWPQAVITFYHQRRNV